MTISSEEIQAANIRAAQWKEAYDRMLARATELQDRVIAIGESREALVKSVLSILEDTIGVLSSAEGNASLDPANLPRLKQSLSTQTEELIRFRDQLMGET